MKYLDKLNHVISVICSIDTALVSTWVNNKNKYIRRLCGQTFSLAPSECSKSSSSFTVMVSPSLHNLDWFPTSRTPCSVEEHPSAENGIRIKTCKFSAVYTRPVKEFGYTHSSLDTHTAAWIHTQ